MARNLWILMAPSAFLGWMASSVLGFGLSSALFIQCQSMVSNNQIPAATSLICWQCACELGAKVWPDHGWGKQGSNGPGMEMESQTMLKFGRGRFLAREKE
jgi:hypothetical protein